MSRKHPGGGVKSWRFGGAGRSWKPIEMIKAGWLTGRRLWGDALMDYHIRHCCRVVA